MSFPQFRSGHPGSSVMWENSRLGYRDQRGFSYEHVGNFTKERVAGRDLGNRASPVDRPHEETLSRQVYSPERICRHSILKKCLFMILTTTNEM